MDMQKNKINRKHKTYVMFIRKHDILKMQGLQMIQVYGL